MVVYKPHDVRVSIAEQEIYWREQFRKPPVSKILFSSPRSSVQSLIRSKEVIELDKKIYLELKKFCSRDNVRLYITLISTFLVMLLRYTGQEDVIVGSVSSDSIREKEVGIWEKFVNPIALRTNLKGNLSAKELLRQVARTVEEAAKNRDYLFEELVKGINGNEHLTQSPIFQVMFVLCNVPFCISEKSISEHELEDIKEHTTRCDLIIVASEEEGSLRISSEYNAELFDSEFIRRMLGHFQIMLTGIVTNPDQSISTLPLLTETEQHQLLVEWNNTQTKYPHEKCIHQLFEAQVERTPDAVAVVFEEQQLTYQDLNQRSNQLANYLQVLGVGAEVLVGICVECSIEMMVGLIGILKAGGAYVPLDPSNPLERLNYILEDAQVQVLVTNSQLRNTLAQSNFVVYLDEEADKIAQYPGNNLVSGVQGDNLAYMIYTSGSTGKPKGVLITHHNVVRLFKATEGWYQFNETDIWTLFHSFAFDFSVWELWGGLLYGGCVVVVPYEVSRDSQAFYNLLIAEQVTVLNQTPSAFYQLIQVDKHSKTTEKLGLRFVIFGGEALSLPLLQPWFERHGDQLPQLVNMYGITETTVHVTIRRLTLADVKATSSLIGLPISDLQIYLLDKYQQPIPLGVVGEIYVGGGGVARGYWRRSELTEERFVLNPFSNQQQGRLYKTGDLARYLPTGELEYKGRIDHQVKIRGFRIELGEIKALLCQHQGVRECVVLAREDEPNHKRLVAYIVPDHTQASTILNLVSLREQGILSEPSLYELPNGMTITHLNKTETEFLYQEIFTEQSYLQNGITLDEGDCIFDVGANIGLFSLFAAQACPKVKIYAFEPIPPVFELLRLNAELYNLDAKVFNIGLSGEKKSAEFTYYPNVSVISGRFADAFEEKEVVKSFLLKQQEVTDGTSVSQEVLDELLIERLQSEQFTCQLKTISHIIEENQIERIDLLKIDVEKSERDVLAGIKERDWLKIQQIIVEVHDINGRLTEITELLKSHGYDLTIVQDKLLETTPLYNIYARRTTIKQRLPQKTGAKSFGDRQSTWNSLERYIQDLRHYLNQKLPDYMIPSAFVVLEKFPLTSNGKVNSRALPIPKDFNSRLESSFVPPNTPTQEILANFWAEILSIEKIGIYDNFFELGGHSLLATKLLYQIRNTFQVDLSWRCLFELPTVAGLATHLEAARPTELKEHTLPLRSVSRSRELPLSFPQTFVWLQNQRNPGARYSRGFYCLRLIGLLQVAVLQQSLDEIIRRHEVLRTSFAIGSKQPIQIVASTKTIMISVVDLCNLVKVAQEAEVERIIMQEDHRPFDLAKDFFLRLTLLQLDSTEYVLLFKIHRIVCDTWSSRIIIREITALYEAFSQGKPSPLPELPIQYADFAVCQQQWLQTGALETQLTYWKRQMGGFSTRLELPTKQPQSTAREYWIANTNFALPTSLSEAIKTLSHQQGVTLFMTLLAALQTLLYCYTNQIDIVVCTQTAQRNRQETESLIGLFDKTLALRTNLSGNPTFRELLRRVRDVTLGAYAHQDLPFHYLLSELSSKKIASLDSISQVVFTVANAPNSDLKLPEVKLSPIKEGIINTSYINETELWLNMYDTKQGIVGDLEYRIDLFDATTITRLLKDFEVLLSSIVAQPDTRIESLRPK